MPPVADIYASIGFNADDFYTGLNKARRDFRAAADDIRAQAQGIHKALREGFTLQTLAKLDPQTLRGIAEYGENVRKARQYDEEFQRAIRNREVVMKAASDTERRAEREAAAAREAAFRQRQFFDKAHADTRARQLSDANRQFSAAMERRDRAFDAEQAPSSIFARANSNLGRSLSGFGVVMGAYMAKDLMGGSLNRAADIQRQSMETGFNNQDVQRLQRVAIETNTPVETMMVGLSRAQGIIQSGKPETQQMVKDLGLDFKRLREEVNETPTAIFQIIQAIQSLDSAAKQSDALAILFGGRSETKSLRALSLAAAGGGTGSALTDEEIASAARAKATVAGLGLSVENATMGFMAQIINAASGRQGVQGIGTIGGAVGGGILGGAGIGALLGGLGGSIIPGAGTVIGAGLGAAGGVSFTKLIRSLFGTEPKMPADDLLESPFESPDFKARESRAQLKEEARLSKIAEREKRRSRRQYESAMDAFAPKGLRNMNALARDYQEGLDYIDEYGGTQEDRENLTSGYNSRVAEEHKAFSEEVMQKQQDELNKTRDLLNQFGAAGKMNAEMMTTEFGKLTQAFKAGKIGITELKEATATFYAMQEEEAMRPGLRLAIKMFEQGQLSAEGLRQSRKQQGAFDTRSAAEDAYIRGDISEDDLMAAQRRFRRAIPETPSGRSQRMHSNIYQWQTSGGSGYSMPAMKPQSSGNLGTVNIIPLDQASDAIIRRWQQQGLSVNG